jgi:hypothetical protein
VEARRPEGGNLLHHSDRGCQYTSDAYQHALPTLGIQCSMSRTGCCYDNAVMERFFWSLKHEWTNHENFDNLADARLSVFRYNNGGGFADHVEVPEGITVKQFFSDRVKQGSAADYLIRVNRQPVPSDQVLQDGDRVSFTPVKIEGASR